jgi:hypothetical protein
LLNHAVRDVPELTYVKQVWDQDMRPLQENQNRNRYPVKIFGDDGHNPFDGWEFKVFKDGFNPFDDFLEEVFEYF